MKKLQTISCLLVFACAFFACRQQPAPTLADNKAKADSTLSFMRQTINPLFRMKKAKESGPLLDSLQPVVDKLNDLNLTLTFWRFKGVQYNLKGQHDSALWWARKSLALAEERDSTKKHIAGGKTQLADIFIDTKQFDSALIYAREAYDLAKKVDTNGLQMICMKLYSINSAIGDLDGMRKYLFEGYAVSNEPHYKMSFAGNISAYYDRIKQPDSALLFFEQFVKDSSLSIPSIDAIKNENYGILLTKKGKLEEGLQYQLKAIAMYKEQGNATALSFFNLGVTYRKLHRYAEALPYLEEALPKAIEEEDLELVYKIFDNKAMAYAGLNQYKQAYAALDSSFNSYSDLTDSNLVLQTRELETKYSVKAKDEEIRALAAINTANTRISSLQKGIIIALGVAFLLTIVLGILLWRRKKLAQKFQEASLEQRLLRSQMQPHFIFNTLSVLQSFIRNNERDSAIKYLNQFARLVRISLDNARESFVPLTEEITALENYLSLQAMRFEGLFDYQVEVYEGYDEDDIFIPPMLLQPFVENAVLHGMKQLSYKGMIYVNITKELHVLRCEIDDNGIGYQKLPQPTEKQSLSTTITQERLTMLSRQTRQPSSLTIIDKRNEHQQGTRVIVNIPFRKTKDLPGSGKKVNGF